MHAALDWFFIIVFVFLLWWWWGPGARLARRHLWPQAGGLTRALCWTFVLLALLTFAAWARAGLVRWLVGLA